MRIHENYAMKYNNVAQKHKKMKIVDVQTKIANLKLNSCNAISVGLTTALFAKLLITKSQIGFAIYRNMLDPSATATAATAAPTVATAPP